MNVYLITPTTSFESDDEIATIGPELERRICEAVPDEKDRFMLPGRAGCYVCFDGISSDLRKKLNLLGKTGDQASLQSANRQPSSPPDQNENAPITAVITRVVPLGYNGYAISDLWEWLSLKTMVYS